MRKIDVVTNYYLPFVNIIVSAKKQDKKDGILLQETLVDSGSGRLEPVLDLDDLIKVSLLPSEEVEPGQIAVTFLPAEERVVR